MDNSEEVEVEGESDTTILEGALLSLISSRGDDEANKVVVDALPYIDTEYDETGMKEMVTHLIEEEKKRYRPTKNYLDHLPPPPVDPAKFETPLLTTALNNLASRLPLSSDVLSMKRYELPPPPPGKLTDLSAWMECVDNSYAQLEHQQIRLWNLQLQLEYGAEGWKSYLEILTRMTTQAQGRLTQLKKAIQGVNWDRKSSQLGAGEQLSVLESNWVSLVSKNYEIQQACLELEKEIEERRTVMARQGAMAV